MAALVCDICGGKLVMGSGGVAVCDSCGMEYSTERMREKVQEIKGTVRVDNSHMVDNWMKMGISAAQSGNNKEAYDYYTKVIEIEPNNWRAIFERGKAAAWQSTLGKLRTSELYHAVKEALSIVSNIGMPENEQSELKNEFAIAIFNVNNAILSLKQQNFDRYDELYSDRHWDEWWELHYTAATTNISQTEDVLKLIDGLEDDISKSNVLEMKKHICDILRFSCEPAERVWHNYRKQARTCMSLSKGTKEKLVKKYVELIAEIREIEPNYATDKYSQIDPFDTPTLWSYEWSDNRRDNLLKYWKEKEQEMQELRRKEETKKRHTAYWEIHFEEKKQYEKRITEIVSEIKSVRQYADQLNVRIVEIKKEFNQQCAAERQLAEIKRQQTELEKQKSGLGLFAGKQKKQIDAHIESLQQQIPSIEEAIKRQKKSIQDDVSTRVAAIETERKPYLDKISTLENEKRNIMAELTKDR